MAKSELLGNTPQCRVEVTEDIIERSIARNSNHCMIAEAVKRADPRLSRVCVDLQTVRATNQTKGERYVWLTPRTAQLAIIAFDIGESPPPFRFFLRNGQTVRTCVKTPMQKEKMRAAYRTRYKASRALVAMRRLKNHGKEMPQIKGGRTPPTAPGARRGFGLRALQY